MGEQTLCLIRRENDLMPRSLVLDDDGRQSRFRTRGHDRLRMKRTWPNMIVAAEGKDELPGELLDWDSSSNNGVFTSRATALFIEGRE